MNPDLERLIAKLRAGFPSDITTQDLRDAADALEKLVTLETTAEFEPLIGKKLIGWMETCANGVELFFEDGSRAEFLAVLEGGLDEDFVGAELQTLVRVPKCIG